jgi:pSer/pThr/pTyr-binding forkhead associated (FHA) protein
MSFEVKGALIPVGGGDDIPLIKEKITIGRRESCDVCLRFPNISGLHVELIYEDDCWRVRDLGSTNGIKVNGIRCQDKTLRPGDELSIANRKYTIEYNLPEGRQIIESTVQEDILSQPLLERAGLVRPRREQPPDGKRKGPPPRKDPFADDLDDD